MGVHSGRRFLLGFSSSKSLQLGHVVLSSAKISSRVICQIRNLIPLKTNPAEREKTNR